MDEGCEVVSQPEYSYPFNGLSFKLFGNRHPRAIIAAEIISDAGDENVTCP